VDVPLEVGITIPCLMILLVSILVLVDVPLEVGHFKPGGRGFSGFNPCISKLWT
jgi:hypothetical protein